MKKFVRVSLFGILFLLAAGRAYAQKKVTINPNSFRDSTTFVNLDYKILDLNKYELTLDFTNIGEYGKVKVKWGDNTESDGNVTNAASLLFSHAYDEEGCFPIQMYFFKGSDALPSDSLHAWALNGKLSLEYEILPVGEDKVDGCLSYGADTLLLHFTHAENPPLTRYTINITCEAPMLKAVEGGANGTVEIGSPSEIDLSGNWVQACWANKEEGRRDSIWLIFTEATGVKGAKVTVGMECDYTDNKGNTDFLAEESKTTASIHLFDKPDLRQIFRQSEAYPFPDTLHALSDSLFFNVCAPGGPNEFGIYGNWFAKYQTYVLSMSKPTPTLEDREIFKVQCYYTEDSVWSDKVTPGDEHVKWQNVSGNSDYFNDTTMTFSRAGFYIVRWEIHNQCDEEHPDTLWTSLIRKDNSDKYYDNKFRYIRVYENHEANLDYLGDSVFCLNVKDSVILVDRNRRKFYDKPPKYSLTVINQDTRAEIEEPRELELAETKIYKGGEVINTPDAGDISAQGCDSTTIRLDFKKWGPGNYEVTLGRKGEGCDEERTKTFEFHVGGVPEIRDTISSYYWKDGENTLQNDKGKYRCGSYEFKVPDLSNAFDAKNRDIDSVRYQFTKGTKDSVLVYKQEEGVPENASFLFDSTGNAPNYIRVNIYNSCGVSNTDTVIFYTPVKPDFTVWRDSVEVAGTDTLCLNAEYKYYLHGDLPERYEDSVWFAEGSSVDLNNEMISGGSSNFSKLRKANENYGSVKYSTTGEYTEEYKVVNADFQGCVNRSKADVVILDAPDASIYKNDSVILYCASIDTLDTRVLFKEEDKDKNPVEPVFNRVTWEGWKGGVAVNDEKFPKLLFRDGKNDTLYVSTIQSTNCYFRDTLIFKPQPVPQANFAAFENFCVPDTLRKEDFLGVVHGNWDEIDSVTWNVYKNVYIEGRSDSLVYGIVDKPNGEIVLNEQSADSIRLIYRMQNSFDRMYMDFSDGGCWSLDTLLVKVYKPRLEILKKDTLDEKNTGEEVVYDLGRIQPKYLKIKDVQEASLKWEKGRAEYTGSFDNSTPPKYTLSEDDKKLDSLQFVLTGKTNCDVLISDTLIVYYPRIDITAHRDTICSNTTDYLLWGPGKTTGQFVDTASLTWKIIKNESYGELLPTTKGSGVIYKPNENSIGGDTVKIKVTGRSIAHVGEKSDTILLWINPKPEYTPWQSSDTLIAINQEIRIDKIKALKYQNVSGLKATSNGWSSVESDSLIKSSLKPLEQSTNSVFTANIVLRGLPGCADDTIKNIPMMDLVYPGAGPKYTPLDLCADEVYGVDSLVTFENDRKDRFTVWKWSNTGGGSWNSDTTVYKAGSTGGIGIETIKLAMNKCYIAYDSTTQCLLPLDSVQEIKVNVHVEPGIRFQPTDKDTLCSSIDTIRLTRGAQGSNAKILVTPSFYKDSLRFNGEELSNNDIYKFRKQEGETDTVYVSVAQGRCSYWSGYKQALYLYRRGLMPKKLDNWDVCENGSVTIAYPEGVLKQEYYWKWDTVNGRLDTTGRGLSPVYYPKTTAEGMVELHVESWPNCEEEEYDFSRITVYKHADLSIPKEKIVCKKEGTLLQIPIEIISSGTSVADVKDIEWYKGNSRNNVTTAITNVSSTPKEQFEYSLTSADIASDTMYIVAKTVFDTPCGNEPTNDTVVIVLSGQPVISQLQTPELCQGDTLKLLKASGSNDWLKIENAVSVEWSKGSLGNIQDSLFLPGENSGSTQLTAVARGIPGCMDDTQPISIEIRKADIPEFDIISSLSCQGEQTELKATIAASQWEWEIEGMTYNTEIVSHKFKGAGDIDVSLKQTYTYGSGFTCSREYTGAVEIHPEARAGFEVITDFEHDGMKQIATREALNVRNTSQPEEGSSAQWDVERYISSCNQWELNCESYTFSDTGKIAIKLKVTTQYGCTDDSIGYVKVVAKPEPKLTVVHDPCKDTVSFELSAEGLNGATVWWDFGKGDGFVEGSGAAENRTEAYFVGYEDTTYHVALKLKNAAGEVEVKKEIHFISNLEASFEIVPEKSGCHEIYRTIDVKIKGKNDAGYVIWGDKWYNPDSKMDSVPFTGNITFLKHRFENSFYPSPVTDTIRLHVRNACFAVADTNYLTVLPASVSAEIELLNGNSLCFQDDVLKVRNASIGFDKATAEWEWKFESGNNVWEQSNRDTATHRYLSPGRYTVILNMRDRCNEDTTSQKITVKGNDSLWFEMLSEPYCTGQTVTMKFVQKGTPEFSDLRWTIYEQQSGRSLKIGADSTQLSYKFTEAGDYGVLLSGKADGCEDRQTLPLHINETPVAMISLVPGSKPVICEPDAVEFQAADGSGLSRMPHILWDFRNGVKSSELREKVVFEKEGIYNVSLTLESEAGCVSRDSMEITVKHTPRISFVTDDSLYCTQNGTFEVAVDNTSEDMDRCRFEWFKKVGAGSEESIGLQPQFSSPLLFENVSGVIGLRLFATDLQTGCVKDFTKEIVASEAVKAHIFKEAEHVCLDNPVYFASRTESNVAKVEWNMGNGEMSVDTAFEYTYDRVGDKMITLRVENEDGCYDSDTLSITVYPLPVADFEWEKNSGVVEGYPDTLDLPEVDNGGVEFTNYSTVTPDDWGTELYYSWNFGDSTTMNAAKNPTHRFENNGLYEVWLKATTAYGCVDSVVRTVSIDAVKGLYIPTAFAPAMPDEDLGEGNSYMGSARFQPKGIGLYSYQIQVYDPWSGTCVWSSTALKDGQPAEYWDGKFNGADAPAGNYIWKVNAIFIDGSVWQNEKGAMEGLVMLIR